MRPAGLYQQSRVQASPCLLTDTDFLQALAAIGGGGAEVAKSRAGRKQGKGNAKSNVKDGTEDEIKASALAGWEDSEKPPRFHNLQLLLRLLTIVSKLQVVLIPKNALISAKRLRNAMSSCRFGNALTSFFSTHNV